MGCRDWKIKWLQRKKSIPEADEIGISTELFITLCVRGGELKCLVELF